MKKKILFGACALALFALLILLLKKADVAPIAAAGTSVGLSKLNDAFHKLTGVHFALYDLTEWLGIAAIFIAVCFALLGLWQMVRRRSLLKVDKSILALGALYAVIAVLYLFFEKFIVNYRPILMPGETLPEASFPSSHTMLFCVVLGSAAMLAEDYIPHPRAAGLVKTACWALVCLAVAARLLSGVHWLTDIVGGALISAALLCLFSAAREKLAE